MKLHKSSSSCVQGVSKDTGLDSLLREERAHARARIGVGEPASALARDVVPFTDNDDVMAMGFHDYL